MNSIPRTLALWAAAVTAVVVASRGGTPPAPGPTSGVGVSVLSERDSLAHGASRPGPPALARVASLPGPASLARGISVPGALALGRAASLAGPPSPGRSAAFARPVPLPVESASPATSARSHPSRPDLGAADSIVSSWVEGARIPGAVLLVSSSDSVVLERAYGSAQRWAYGSGQYGAWRTGDPNGGLLPLERPVPMEAGTVFDLASLTKVMATTFAVMLLVDDGALDLDAPVSTWLPDFTGGGKDRITPRHLLTHRAGLSQWQPIYYHASDADEAYAYIRHLPLAWDVGEDRHYSDLGFMLLGRIVERASGRTLDDFLRARLYGPLGLIRTGYRPADPPGPGGPPEGGEVPAAAAPSPDSTASPAAAFSDPVASPLAGTFAATSHGNPFEFRMVHDSTFGYRVEGDPDGWEGWRRRTLVGEVNDGNAWHAFRGLSGHAGLFSTAAELRVLLQLLLDGGERGGRRWVAEATIDAFLTSTGEGQALGWQVPDWAPPGSFAHSGFTGTWVLGVPSRDLAVVLLTNRQNGGIDADGRYPDLGPLQRAVGEALLSRPGRDRGPTGTPASASRPRHPEFRVNTR